MQHDYIIANSQAADIHDVVQKAKTIQDKIDIIADVEDQILNCDCAGQDPMKSLYDLVNMKQDISTKLCESLFQEIDEYLGVYGERQGIIDRQTIENRL